MTFGKLSKMRDGLKNSKKLEKEKESVRKRDRKKE